MYRGFKLKSFTIDDKKEEIRLFELGQTLFSKNRAKCETKLRDFMTANNSLDGSALVQSWFPQIDAQVFISHSHADERLAKVLAGWLYDCFELESFIDSCVWGYADTLLKIIDNTYCLNENRLTYDYDKRNRTTSHVHMMLATALSMTIDKTECLLFLNTPQSIVPVESITKTQSAWLYYEIGISQIIKKKVPNRIMNEGLRTFSEKEYFEKALQIEYQVDLSHLNELNFELLNRWMNSKGMQTSSDALDRLYLLSPEKRYSNSLHG
jgi:hypothetical protein